MYNPRFQIAAVLVYIVILFFYIKGKRIKSNANIIYKALIVSSIFNLFIDFITYYLAYNPEKFNEVLTSILFQVLYISMIAIFVGIYFYISTIGRKENAYRTKQVLLRLSPLLIAVVLLCLNNIEIKQGYFGPYAIGLSTIGVLVIAVFYIAGVIGSVIRHRNNITIEGKKGVSLVLISWAIFIVVEALVPSLLVSGIAIAIINLILYISFENSKMFINDENDCFNNISFQLVASDYFRKGESFIVMNLVLDEFEVIHTRFGHDFGQAVVKHFASEITSQLKKDVFSTKENVLTFFANNDADANHLGNVIKEWFNSSFIVNGIRINTIAHVDLIECPKYCKNNNEVIDMMEFMMNSHQEQFARETNEAVVEKRQRNIIIEEMIRKAIKEDGFEIRYQPIYSSYDKKFVSAEALIRFKKNNKLGYVSPEEFIPLAEEKGLINDIGEIMLNKVCSFSKKNKLWEKGVKYIEVNLSGLQCSEYMLPTQINNIINTYEIPPSFINLEITETAAVEAGELLDKNITKLKNFGFTFSMDDFGTGYSNLAKMAELPYSLIKIDKSLVWGYFDQNNKKGKALLENVVKMILDMGFKIVAEGVENKEMAETLINMKVNYLQGYYYSKPIFELEYIDYLDRNNFK